MSHLCTCFRCCPALEPPLERLGPHHASTRWGDHTKWRVKFNGEWVVFCVEAIAGSPGWIWAVREPAHICCGRNMVDGSACITKMPGIVELVPV